MLKIQLKSGELFNDDTQEFVEIDFGWFELEHSLLSLSKWESIHKIPFLGTEEKTNEQLFSYIHCMIVSGEISVESLQWVSQDCLNQINAYIEDTMTATWFRESNQQPSREVITSELIYYWMTAFRIPTEYERWHLNRLLTLIRICSVKNQPEKKMSPAEAAAERRRINQERRAQMGSTG